MTRTSRGHKFVIGFLLVIFSFLVFHLIDDKSPTTDEVSFHMVNGYTYLKTRDFRMSPATPSLGREWMALPWLIMNPKLDLEGEDWAEGESVPFAVKFFYSDNRDMAELLLYSSRFMVYLLAFVLGIGIFCWSKKLYGATAGLVSLTLYVFSPTILGHSAIATVDIGVTLFYFGAIYYLYLDNEKSPEPVFSWKAAVCLGLGLATKYTIVLLCPVILLLLVMRMEWWKGLISFTAMMGIVFLVLWPAYLFEFKPLLENVPRLDEKIAYIGQISDFFMGGNAQIREQLIYAAQNWPIPFASWILGFAGILRSHSADYLHYFMGEWTQKGIWYHYLFSFAAKTTIAFLVLIVLRLLTLRYYPDGRKNRAHLYLLLPVIILVVTTFFDSTGVGIRYLLPVFPFLFVWAGGLWIAAEGKRYHSYVKLACIILLVSHVGSSLLQFPDSIAYFNGLVGGPKNGYKYVRGSDVDWGQELKNLAEYAEDKNINRMKTYLFGTRDESFYGIPSIKVEEDEFISPADEVYAISTFNIQHFEWTQHIEPVDRIGNAIFVYDFRGES